MIISQVSKDIPKEQAAYQPGRSTGEQILTVKLMAEQAINTENYQVFLALFDMSKAFDTVNREILFQHLEKILKPDELHLLCILINEATIKVKINDTRVSLFTQTLVSYREIVLVQFFSSSI